MHGEFCLSRHMTYRLSVHVCVCVCVSVSVILGLGVVTFMFSVLLCVAVSCVCDVCVAFFLRSRTTRGAAGRMGPL